MARDLPNGPPRRPRARSGAAALCVAIALVAIAGCGGGDDGAGTGATSSVGPTGPGSTQGTGTSGTPTNNEGLPRTLGSSNAVRTAVEAVLASGDPAKACDRYVTPRYLKTAYGGKQGCVQAQQPGSAATSLTSFRIEQEGGQGTVVGASAVPRGGPYDGSKVKIGLVFAGDHYRVDQLDSNVPVGP